MYNNKIHLIGGSDYNNILNTNYIINLRNIIGLNLKDINILINYFLKLVYVLNNKKNIKWVKDLNKIIKNFI